MRIKYMSTNFELEIKRIVDDPESGYLRDARAEIAQLELVGATQQDARRMAVSAVIADLRVLQDSITT